MFTNCSVRSLKVSLFTWHLAYSQFNQLNIISYIPCVGVLISLLFMQRQPLYNQLCDTVLSYVCMYCHMYVCIVICMYVLSYVCMYCHMYVCIVICMYVLSYVCMYCHMYVCIVICMQYCHMYVCIVSRFTNHAFNCFNYKI